MHSIERRTHDTKAHPRPRFLSPSRLVLHRVPACRIEHGFRHPSAATGCPSPAATPTPDVTYEPAYPSEVNAAGLNDEDVAQQETTHSHGGEQHEHGDGEHEHGDGEQHEHGDGEQHEHGDGSHGDHDH